MQLSFFCKWCGEHLKKGTHGDCKKALLEEEKREKAAEAAKEARLDACKTSGNG